MQLGMGFRGLTVKHLPCINMCMATKTLSIDEEAYGLLSRAKRTPRESFSHVIKRAKWPDAHRTCSALLARVPSHVPEEILDRLDAAQDLDLPAVDKWRS